MEEFYVDLHCHSTMRAYHTTPKSDKKNIWDTTQNDFIDTAIGRFAWEKSKRVSKLSQSNFYNCIEGKTKVIFDSLYPIERGFINYRKIPKALIGKKRMDSIFVISSGVSKEQLQKYREHNDYFKDLIEQYEFLVQNQGISPCEKYNYKIVNNYAELEESIKNDPNRVNIIVTIEGCHALGVGTIETENIPTDELKQKLTNNINKVKNWEHPPFFVTFAHHFWNQLCGHATTFPIETKLTLNQNKGINIGFTELGHHALEELLSKKNGKRILIDTRHMSAKSRAEYVNYVRNHNKNNADDIIPIITSHSGVNGHHGFDSSILQKDKFKKTKNTPYYAWSINISGEEARAINESGGLMGLILDKGRLSGINLLKSVEKISDKKEQKKLFNKMIWDNIFFFVDSIKNKSGWDNLSLGTDFDGAITHIDPYHEMSTLPELKKDLITFIKESKDYKKELWYGYEPEEMVHKIFTQNAMDFLKKHFK